MSLEQAINEHAAAIRELAAAIRLTTSAGGNGFSTADQLKYDQEQEALAVAKEAELEKAVAKLEADAKAEQAKVMAKVEADRKPNTAKEAVTEALAKAKAEKEAADKVAFDAKTAEMKKANDARDAADAAKEADPLDAAPLHWDNDVRPALLAVGKDRDALVKLMAKYEVPKGGKAPAEKWADLLAEANAIVAARG